ncbi:MAG: hypothetical protein HYX68_06115 [Planctomycetes bacterium]|jgi:hypothetical protein|nr:hypothetical protein [Planctomycetota bacterium]
MLRHSLFSLAVLGCVLFLASAQTGKSVKSGPQVGAEVPGPFHPLNVTGEHAGKKACLFCLNSGNPVAVVFAREATPAVAKLLKQLDLATIKHAKANMGSFAVFCSNSEGLDKRLEKIASQQKLIKLVLSIDNPTGPKGYAIAKDAEVTVFLYKTVEEKDGFTQRVLSNHAFGKGQLNDAGIARVVADVSKIVK